MRLTRKEKDRILQSFRREVPFEKLPVDEQRVLIALGDISIHVKELQDLPGSILPCPGLPLERRVESNVRKVIRPESLFAPR